MLNVLVHNHRTTLDTILIGLREEIIISLFVQYILGEAMVVKWQNN
jgi:hypothetical protein